MFNYIISDKNFVLYKTEILRAIDWVEGPDGN